MLDGLKIPMHHHALVHRPQRRGDAHPQRQALAEGEVDVLEALGERLALQPLHGQVRPAPRRGPAPDVPDDVGMAEGREQLRLAGEALDSSAPT